jgi:hypothetical protein
VATLIDGNGRIYWYRPQSGLGDFDRTLDGSFVNYDIGGYQLLALDGSILATYTDPLANNGVDNHEFVSLPDGHAILFGQNLRPVDTTGYTQPGDPNAVEIENTIAELDATGAVLKHFALGDQITLAETTPDIDLDVSPIDAMHANSIGLLADGNLLVSLRHTDTVYKLARTDGTILWRLGGTRSDFTFVNDSLGGFSHQHYARQLGNGDILLFDDGNLHQPQLSRVVEYALDEGSQTATLVWEYRRTDVVSTCCGSTTRLGSGDTLTAWGSAGRVDVVDDAGAQLWQLTIPAAIVYRAIPVATLYP